MQNDALEAFEAPSDSPHCYCCDFMFGSYLGISFAILKIFIQVNLDKMKFNCRQSQCLLLPIVFVFPQGMNNKKGISVSLQTE